MTTQDARPIKIEVKNLTKRFGDLLVLDDMNFTIRKGEFLRHRRSHRLRRRRRSSTASPS